MKKIIFALFHINSIYTSGLSSEERIGFVGYVLAWLADDLQRNVNKLSLEEYKKFAVSLDEFKNAYEKMIEKRQS